MVIKVALNCHRRRNKQKTKQMITTFTQLRLLLSSHFIENVQNTCAVATQHERQERMRKSFKTFTQTSQLQWWDTRRSFGFYLFPVWTKEGPYEAPQTSPDAGKGVRKLSDNQLDRLEDIYVGVNKVASLSLSLFFLNIFLSRMLLENPVEMTEQDRLQRRGNASDKRGRTKNLTTITSSFIAWF